MINRFHAITRINQNNYLPILFLQPPMMVCTELKHTEGCVRAASLGVGFVIEGFV